MNKMPKRKMDANFRRDSVSVTVIIPTRKLKTNFITMKCLEELKDRWEIIICRHKGVSRARNAGVRHASGKIICFLEDDILFDQQELCSLIETYISGTVLTAHLSFPTCPMIGRITIISKNDFLLVGGFNELIRFGGEGADFILRCIRNGIKWNPTKFNIKHLSRPYNLKIEMVRSFYETFVLLKWKRKYKRTTHILDCSSQVSFSI